MAKSPAVRAFHKLKFTAPLRLQPDTFLHLLGGQSMTDLFGSGKFTNGHWGVINGLSSANTCCRKFGVKPAATRFI
jgi:hypothetical protein